MIVDSDRAFPKESAVCAYWLTRCEGFTVRSESRVLGVVESIAGDGRLGLAETLLVRSRHKQRLVHADEVTAVVPARRLLIAARQPAPPRARPVTAATIRLGNTAGHTLVHALARLASFLAPRVRAGAVTAGRLSLALAGTVRKELLPRAVRGVSQAALALWAVAGALLDEVERLTALDGQPQPEAEQAARPRDSEVVSQRRDRARELRQQAREENEQPRPVEVAEHVLQ